MKAVAVMTMGVATLLALTDTTDKDFCAPNVACSRVYSPICGSDGTTYNNECLFKIAQCTESTLAKVDDAPCPRVEEVCVASCPDIFKPVCGSDGLTYENECTLKRDACVKKTGITLDHIGDCDGEWPPKLN
ncbi:hypothetical protein LEN26_006205 [Aphanomyces euteiches]|nr:hypothetical protein LEN26_006205 [Aphanomyces euteiches]